MLAEHDVVRLEDVIYYRYNYKENMVYSLKIA